MKVFKQTVGCVINSKEGRKEYDAVVVYLVIRSRKCYAEDITYPSASFNVYLYLFPLVPLVHPPSWVPETHMGALPPGKPVWVPIHSVLTLPPSVNSSPVCCSFANRTIQMVSSLLSPRPPTLAPSEGRGDSLSDLCSSQNTLHIHRPCSLIQRDDPRTRPIRGVCFYIQDSGTRNAFTQWGFRLQSIGEDCYRSFCLFQACIHSFIVTETRGTSSSHKCQ